MTFEFTNNWFEKTAQGWDKFPKAKSVLEIGSYEGKSSVWIIQNILEAEGSIICIDTWSGGEEHDDIDFEKVEARFDENVKKAVTEDKQVYKIKGTSVNGLSICLVNKRMFDFIYIDGSHIARDVLTDACMAWPMLTRGGIIVFDDYKWGKPRDILHRPKLAIDSFINIFAEELNLITCGTQIVVRKI